jgi:methyltransferase (TIGR00027 family)
VLAAAARPTELAARAAGLSNEWVAELVGSSRLIHQMAKRTLLLDAALLAKLPFVEQLVVLGAGFDTRGVSPEVARSGVRVFEVDTGRTQPMKRSLYASSGANSSGVTFVEVDFTREHWLDKLEASGFDCSRPTYFHWEGVSYYLPREVVTTTLRDMSRCGSGSVVALDYFSQEVVQGTQLVENVLLNRLVGLLGEPFDFGLEMSPPARQHAAGWIVDTGLKLEETATMHPERAGRSQFSGILVASVQ